MSNEVSAQTNHLLLRMFYGNALRDATPWLERYREFEELVELAGPEEFRRFRELDADEQSRGLDWADRDDKFQSHSQFGLYAYMHDYTYTKEFWNFCKIRERLGASGSTQLEAFEDADELKAFLETVTFEGVQEVSGDVPETWGLTVMKLVLLFGGMLLFPVLVFIVMGAYAVYLVIKGCKDDK